MESKVIDFLVDQVIEQYTSSKMNLIEVEASGRHVHLSNEHIECLFGKGYELTKERDLSQPGQYVCKERVMIIGPKGLFKNVVILGPARKKTQVEISITDGRNLGVNAPVKESGKLDEAASIVIASENSAIIADSSTIIAQRHLHMSPEDATLYNVKDNEIVRMRVYSERPLTFEDVLVRVSSSYRTCLHIDYDEANACGFKKGTFAKLMKQASGSVGL